MMDILNKKISCVLLHDVIIKDGMFVLRGGFLCLDSNDDLLSHLPNPVRNSYRYSLRMEPASEDTVEKGLAEWRARDIRFLRKMNHEV
jgi:hypothetical protein